MNPFEYGKVKTYRSQYRGGDARRYAVRSERRIKVAASFLIEYHIVTMK